MRWVEIETINPKLGSVDVNDPSFLWKNGKPNSDLLNALKGEERTERNRRKRKKIPEYSRTRCIARGAQLAERAMLPGACGTTTDPQAWATGLPRKATRSSTGARMSTTGKRLRTITRVQDVRESMPSYPKRSHYRPSSSRYEG
jgi:hypothetical protein